MLKIYFWFKNLLDDENGLGTVEIIIIIAVLVGIALLFKDKITEFVEKILDNVFSDDVIDKATEPLED
ncbi:MAG: Flp1 family type IVb pilin [Clostridiales bacterium]